MVADLPGLKMVAGLRSRRPRGFQVMWCSVCMQPGRLTAARWCGLAPTAVELAAMMAKPGKPLIQKVVCPITSFLDFLKPRHQMASERCGLAPMVGWSTTEMVSGKPLGSTPVCLMMGLIHWLKSVCQMEPRRSGSARMVALPGAGWTNRQMGGLCFLIPAVRLCPITQFTTSARTSGGAFISLPTKVLPD